MKNILLALLLISTLTVKAQPQPDGIYTVIISQVEQKDSIKRSYYITIDSIGNVYLDYKLRDKINITGFNTAVNSFMKREKMIKSEPDNDPPAREATPGRNSKDIMLQIVKHSDKIKDRSFHHPTTYASFKRNMMLNDFSFPFFNYLSKMDRNKILKLLK